MAWGKQSFDFAYPYLDPFRFQNLYTAVTEEIRYRKFIFQLFGKLIQMTYGGFSKQRFRYKATHINCSHVDNQLCYFGTSLETACLNPDIANKINAKFSFPKHGSSSVMQSIFKHLFFLQAHITSFVTKYVCRILHMSL